MAQISVVICCCDSQDTLEPACLSVAWADELIIVDSGSKDATAQIAKRYGDRYVLEPWRGHSGQKQFASELCRNDWVFLLDGDEECSKQLAKQLQQMSADRMQRYDLFLVPRRNYVMGRPVRAWWPDRLTRIFHRRRVSWDGHVLHDTRAPSHPSRLGVLKGHLIHKRYSKAGFADYFCGQRLDQRLLEVARQMYDRGKRCSIIDLVFRPSLAFIKFYVLKRGFLDGSLGVLIAQKASVSTQLKYAALWAVQKQQRRKDAAGSGDGG